MARPNEPDMPPKASKKVRLSVYCTQNPVIFLVVTVIKSVRRPVVWLARRIIRVDKRRKK